MNLSSALASSIFLLFTAVSATDVSPTLSRNLRNGNGNGNYPFEADGDYVMYIADINGEDDTAQQSYIVTFNDKVNNSNRPGMAGSVAKGAGATVDNIYSTALNGASMTMPPAAAKALVNNPNVASVEKDLQVTASAVPWGLDRINQCSGRDGKSTKEDASSVKVYIIDTGIQASHNEFGNNLVGASCSFSAFTKGSPKKTDPLIDGNGHGTHVASTTCGDGYGVATCKRLCAVKVLDQSGSGSTSGVIAGIDFAIKDCVDGEKCVANMSLGGGKSDSLNQAVANAVESGVTMVVAAGNENSDACTKSPASEPSAITVGATDSMDNPASFTNHGSCVDVYAPGVSIPAAWSSSDTATKTMDGTSMASPHVAGIAAGLCQQGVLASQIKQKIKAASTVQNVDCRTSGAGIATILPDTDCNDFNSCDSTPPPPPPECGCGGLNTEYDQACCDHFQAHMFAVSVQRKGWRTEITCETCN